MTKQEIKEMEWQEIVFLANRWIFPLDREVFLRHLNPVFSSTLDTAFEAGRKQERERVKKFIEVNTCDGYDKDCEMCRFSKDVYNFVDKLEKENE